MPNSYKHYGGNAPYYAPYNENENYVKVLYNPGRALQARELIDSQTYLQHQLSALGGYFFKDGSPIDGAVISFSRSQNVLKVNADSTFSGYNNSNSIEKKKEILDQFIGRKFKNISRNVNYNLTELKKQKELIVTDWYYDSNYNEYYILFSYLGANFNFENNDNIESLSNIYDFVCVVETDDKLIGVDSSLFFTVSANTSTSKNPIKALIASCSKGCIFVDGYFVTVPQSNIVVDILHETNSNIQFSKLTYTYETGETEEYTKSKSFSYPYSGITYYIGYEINRKEISAKEDANLYDTASGTYNYKAPGANRMQISATLTSYYETYVSRKEIFDEDVLDSYVLVTNKPTKYTQETNNNEIGFISGIVIQNDKILKENTIDTNSSMNDLLAKRTYEESGSYTVNPWKMKLMDSINSVLYNKDTGYKNKSLYYSIAIGEGLGYIYGYRIKTLKNDIIINDKPREYSLVTNSGKNVSLTGNAYTLANFITVNDYENNRYDNILDAKGFANFKKFESVKMMSEKNGQGKEILLYDKSIWDNTYTNLGELITSNTGAFTFNIDNIDSFLEISNSIESTNEPYNITTSVYNGKSYENTSIATFQPIRYTTGEITCTKEQGIDETPSYHILINITSVLYDRFNITESIKDMTITNINSKDISLSSNAASEFKKLDNSSINRTKFYCDMNNSVLNEYYNSAKSSKTSCVFYKTCFIDITTESDIVYNFKFSLLFSISTNSGLYLKESNSDSSLSYNYCELISGNIKSINETSNIDISVDELKSSTESINGFFTNVKITNANLGYGIMVYDNEISKYYIHFNSIKGCTITDACVSLKVIEKDGNNVVRVYVYNNRVNGIGNSCKFITSDDSNLDAGFIDISSIEKVSSGTSSKCEIAIQSNAFVLSDNLIAQLLKKNTKLNNTEISKITFNDNFLIENPLTFATYRNLYGYNVVYNDYYIGYSSYYNSGIINIDNPNVIIYTNSDTIDIDENTDTHIINKDNLPTYILLNKFIYNNNTNSSKTHLPFSTKESRGYPSWDNDAKTISDSQPITKCVVTNYIIEAVNLKRATIFGTQYKKNGEDYVNGLLNVGYLDVVINATFNISYYDKEQQKIVEYKFSNNSPDIKYTDVVRIKISSTNESDNNADLIETYTEQNTISCRVSTLYPEIVNTYNIETPQLYNTAFKGANTSISISSYYNDNTKYALTNNIVIDSFSNNIVNVITQTLKKSNEQPFTNLPCYQFSLVANGLKENQFFKTSEIDYRSSYYIHSGNVKVKGYHLLKLDKLYGQIISKNVNKSNNYLYVSDTPITVIAYDLVINFGSEESMSATGNTGIITSGKYCAIYDTSTKKFKSPDNKYTYTLKSFDKNSFTLSDLETDIYTTDALIYSSKNAYEGVGIDICYSNNEYSKILETNDILEFSTISSEILTLKQDQFTLSSIVTNSNISIPIYEGFMEIVEYPQSETSPHIKHMWLTQSTSIIEGTITGIAFNKETEQSIETIPSSIAFNYDSIKKYCIPTSNAFLSDASLNYKIIEYTENDIKNIKQAILDFEGDVHNCLQEYTINNGETKTITYGSIKDFNGKTIHVSSNILTLNGSKLLSYTDSEIKTGSIINSFESALVSDLSGSNFDMVSFITDTLIDYTLFLNGLSFLYTYTGNALDIIPKELLKRNRAIITGTYKQSDTSLLVYLTNISYIYSNFSSVKSIVGVDSGSYINLKMNPNTNTASIYGTDTPKIYTMGYDNTVPYEFNTETQEFNFEKPIMQNSIGYTFNYITESIKSSTDANGNVYISSSLPSNNGIGACTIDTKLIFLYNSNDKTHLSTKDLVINPSNDPVNSNSYTISCIPGGTNPLESDKSYTACFRANQTKISPRVKSLECRKVTIKIESDDSYIISSVSTSNNTNTNEVIEVYQDNSFSLIKLPDVDIIKIIKATAKSNNEKEVESIESYLIIDNGQTPYMYDFGYISGLDNLLNKYKSNKIIVSEISFIYAYYEHSISNTESITGPFTASSYISEKNINFITTILDDIPIVYNETTRDNMNLSNAYTIFDNTDYILNINSYTNKDVTYKLSDCIDFRPDANASMIYYPSPNSLIQYTLGYFEPRIDALWINSQGEFGITKGIASKNPIKPKEIDNSMLLYYIYHPAYTTNVKDITLEYVNNERYTMKDIAKIDKRIDNIEELLSLSLLEQNALNMLVTDSLGNNRFKSGIFTDSFNDYTRCNLESDEWMGTIDCEDASIRPDFNVKEFNLSLDKSNSKNYEVTDNNVAYMSPSSNVLINSSTYISRTVNITSLLHYDWNGSLVINPTVDNWTETETSLTEIWTDTAKPDDIVYNTWNTEIINEDYSTVSYTDTSLTTTYNSVEETDGYFHNPVVNHDYATTTTQTTQTTQLTTYTGKWETYNYTNEYTTQDSYLRRIEIHFSIKGFRANTKVSAYLVKNSVYYPLVLYENSNADINTEYNTNSTIFYTNTEMQSKKLVIETTNSSGELSGYFRIPNYVPSGNCQIVFSDSKTTSCSADYTGTSYIKHIDETKSNLRVWVENTSIDTQVTTAQQTQLLSTYVSDYELGEEDPLYIAYQNALARIAKLEAEVSKLNAEIVDLNLQLETMTAQMNYYKSLSEDYYKNWQSAEATIKSLTSQLNASKNDTAYWKGLYEEAKRNYDSAMAEIRRLNELISNLNRRIAELEAENAQLKSQLEAANKRIDRLSSDPIAESFFVYDKNGMVLESIDLYFSKIDTESSNQMVHLYIVETDNGYPSKNKLAYSDVYVQSKDIKVISESDISNGNIGDTKIIMNNYATNFKFTSPIYLQPNSEYAFVIETKSNLFEIYYSTMGDVDIVSKNSIDKQPFEGIMFKSANSSTWTAYQESDVAFRMRKYQFSTTKTSSLVFNINYSNAKTKQALVDNFFVDTFTIKSNVFAPSGTEVKYYYSWNNENYIQFVPNKIYDLKERKCIESLLNTSGNLNTSLKIKLDLSTTDSNITPLVDLEQIYGIFTHNNIKRMISYTEVYENEVYSMYKLYQELEKNPQEDKPYNAYYNYTIDGNFNSYEYPNGYKYHTATYVSIPIKLEKDSYSIRVALEALKPKNSDVEVYYKSNDFNDSYTSYASYYLGGYSDESINDDFDFSDNYRIFACYKKKTEDSISYIMMDALYVLNNNMSNSSINNSIESYKDYSNATKSFCELKSLDTTNKLCYISNINDDSIFSLQSKILNNPNSGFYYNDGNTEDFFRLFVISISDLELVDSTLTSYDFQVFNNFIDSDNNINYNSQNYIPVGTLVFYNNNLWISLERINSISNSPSENNSTQWKKIPCLAFSSSLNMDNNLSWKKMIEYSDVTDVSVTKNTEVNLVETSVYKDYTYKPELTDNDIPFNQFSLKVEMYSQDQINVPKIRSIRAIAVV